MSPAMTLDEFVKAQDQQRRQLLLKQSIELKAFFEHQHAGRALEVVPEYEERLTAAVLFLAGQSENLKHYCDFQQVEYANWVANRGAACPS